MSCVSEIRYVGYGVPDLEAERAFYRDIWGLKEVGEQDGMVHFAAEGSDELYVVRLRQSETKRIDVIALAADSRADVDALHDKVVAAGCRIIFAPKELDTLGGGYGFRFFSPDGLTVRDLAATSRAAPRATDAALGGHPAEDQPHRPALARPQGDGPVLHRRARLPRCPTGSATSCASCAATARITASPSCPGRRASTMSPMTCSRVDDMMRGIHRLKQRRIDIALGPGPPHRGQQHLQLFRHAERLCGRIYVRARGGGRRRPGSRRSTRPRPQVMDQWGIGVGGPQTMPHPEPDAGLFQPAEA